MNIAFNDEDANLPQGELFEIAKDSILNGSAMIADRPGTGGQGLVLSITVQGHFPTEDHVLNEAYAIIGRMQRAARFPRGGA